MRRLKLLAKVLSILTILVSCAGTNTSFIPDTANTKQELESLISNFAGDVGIYARHLDSGEEIIINADSLYPTASMIKVPILLALFDRIEKDSLDYDSTFMWLPEVVNYPAGGMLSSFKDSSTIPLTKIISLMITYSDNHASLWCQGLAGGVWPSMSGWTQTVFIIRG